MPPVELELLTCLPLFASAKSLPSRISGLVQLPSKVWLLPVCYLISDRNAIFLGYCCTSKLFSGPKRRTSFSISMSLRLPNDSSLQLHVWPEGHIQLLVHLQKGQSTNPQGEVTRSLDFRGPSGPGLVLPGGLEPLDGPSVHSPPTVSPQTCKREAHSDSGWRWVQQRREDRCQWKHGSDSVERTGEKCTWSSLWTGSL